MGKIATKISLVIVILLLMACPTSADDAIKLGANFALSGNLADYGERATRGATLALEEINSTGGVNGQSLKAIFEDNEGNPAKAISVYQKLRNLDKIDFTLTFLSSIALAVAPLANRDEVIQIDISATTPKYSSPDDYTFRTGIVATHLATEAAQILSEKFKINTIGCLYIENDFGQGMFELFREHFKNKMVIAESFRAGEVDFRSVLLKFKETKIKATLLVGHQVEAGLILRQARNLGIDAQIYSDVYTVEGPDFLKTANDSANGLIYFAPSFDPEKQGPVALNFSTQYSEKYGEQATLYSAQAYDAVRALGLALRNCDTPTPSCVKNELYQIDFEGASGRIKFDKNGDVRKNIELKEIREGAFVAYRDRL